VDRIPFFNEKWSTNSSLLTASMSFPFDRHLYTNYLMAKGKDYEAVMNREIIGAHSFLLKTVHSVIYSGESKETKKKPTRPYK
jgi:hypothetical protein